MQVLKNLQRVDISFSLVSYLLFYLSGIKTMVIIYKTSFARQSGQEMLSWKGNERWNGVAGPRHMCWLFAHGYAAAVARGEMCFHSKPPRRPPAFPQQMQ